MTNQAQAHFFLSLPRVSFAWRARNRVSSLLADEDPPLYARGEGGALYGRNALRWSRPYHTRSHAIALRFERSTHFFCEQAQWINAEQLLFACEFSATSRRMDPSLTGQEDSRKTLQID
jgi:hypothetical protein